MADNFNILDTAAAVNPFQVVQPNEAQKTEDGENFFSTIVKKAVPAATSVELLLITGATLPAVSVSASSDQKTEGFFFEGTLVSANGTAISIFDSNRALANTPLLTWFDGPTITNDGQQLGNGLLPLLVGQGGVSATGNGNRIILKASTNYLIRISNISGGVTDIGVVLDFNEPPS